MMTPDEQMMYRCLQLAALGAKHTAPNPLVGAVLTHKGRIIGEAYHRRYGEAHAEPLAFAAVKEPELLPEATLYVSLEPCSHYGKTPPCAELIVQKKVKRVVIAALDPNPKVSGRGVKMLEGAGIEVQIGVLEKEARELNKRFYCYQEQKRPYVTIKWAKTSDGFIDKIRTSVAEPALAISNRITGKLTHKIRSENMSIMVSTNTVLLDNPSLTVRRWSGENPVRLVLDRQGRIPDKFTVKDGRVSTLIFTERKQADSKNLQYIYPESDFYDIEKILKSLYDFKINSVLVEGGSRLLKSIIDAGVWDEANIETAGFSIGEGVKAPELKGAVLEYEKNYDGHRWQHFRRLNKT